MVYKQAFKMLILLGYSVARQFAITANGNYKGRFNVLSIWLQAFFIAQYFYNTIIYDL